jgi:hypothetical protein
MLNKDTCLQTDIRSNTQTQDRQFVQAEPIDIIHTRTEGLRIQSEGDCTASFREYFRIYNYCALKSTGRFIPKCQYVSAEPWNIIPRGKTSLVGIVILLGRLYRVAIMESSAQRNFNSCAAKE